MSRLKRFASQLTFCAPNKMMRRMVVEQNENKMVTRMFSLDDSSVESAHTLFFDGVISVGLVSLKQSVGALPQAKKISSDYQYVDLSSEHDFVIQRQLGKKLILDFGTNQLDEVNRIMHLFIHQLAQFSLIDIIAACTYYPLHILNENAELDVNMSCSLVVWENVNLLTKNITDITSVRSL